MTAGPRIPETPRQSARKTPAVFVYGAGAAMSCLIGWPIAYFIFLSPIPADDRAAHWLSVGGSTVWFLSLFSLYAMLLALKEHSTPLGIFLKCLEFAFDVLCCFLSL